MIIAADGERGLGGEQRADDGEAAARGREDGHLLHRAQQPAGRAALRQRHPRHRAR